MSGNSDNAGLNLVPIEQIGSDHSQRVGNADFLAGGGLMGERLRAYPWKTTSLGEPRRWPQSLRTAVRLMLATQHPMFIFWGPELTCLYNDAYSRSLGPEKHPAILGSRWMFLPRSSISKAFYC